MRFKIDENLHDDVAALLAAAGHDVETVHTEGLQGCTDQVVAAHCAAKGLGLLRSTWILRTSARFPQRRLTA